MQRVVIFDLDGTTINSAHRTPKAETGHVLLPEYIRMKTRENIFKDTLLPLAKQLKKLYNDGLTYVVICTSRMMDKDDYDYLKANNIQYNKMLSRPDNCTLPDGKFKIMMFNKIRNLKQFKDLPFFFFDDMPENIKVGRKCNFVSIHADKVNKKLAAS